MSLPATGILVGLCLCAVAGLGLLASLVAGSLLMRLINHRLVTLQDALCSIGIAAEPLTVRIASITVNVRKLREAAEQFNIVLAERARVHLDPAVSAEDESR